MALTKKELRKIDAQGRAWLHDIGGYYNIERVDARDGQPGLRFTVSPFMAVLLSAMLRSGEFDRMVQELVVEDGHWDATGTELAGLGILLEKAVDALPSLDESVE